MTGLRGLGNGRRNLALRWTRIRTRRKLGDLRNDSDGGEMKGEWMDRSGRNCKVGRMLTVSFERSLIIKYNLEFILR